MPPEAPAVLKTVFRATSPQTTPQLPGVIEVALFAPYNEVVEVIGSWNNWQPQPMKLQKDGWWRTTVQLKNGDYQYKFRIKSLSYFARGQMLDVFDPYALSITEDSSENSKLRVRQGKRVDLEYTWKHDDVPLPKNEDLVMYELHVGDFSGGNGDAGNGKEREKGKFKYVTEKLNYLRDLGINCIELMPVKEFPGKSWGYSLRSLFAIENSYGSPEELCQLIDEAHGLGMRVIIDGVYNHAEADSPLAKIDYEYWFYKDNPDPKELDFGPKFNYTHYDEHHDVFPARKYVIESIDFWVQMLHIDGIRFDCTVAIKNFDALREMADAAFSQINGIKPFFTIAEHVPEDPAITGRPEGGPMNAAWRDTLGRLLQAIITRQERDGHKPWDLDELATAINPATNGYQKADRVINFITNHDFKRAMQMLGEDGKIFGDAAFRRMALGMGLLITMPGIPMIWMGSEFGFASEKTLEPRPLDWKLLANDGNKNLHDHVAQLIRIRHENSALRNDSFEVVLHDQERLLFGFKRTDGGTTIVIVANLKDEVAGEFVVEKANLEDGMWRDAIHGNEIKVEGGVLRDSLGESELKIFIKKS